MSNGEINRELTILKRAFSLAIQAGKLMMKRYIPLLKENNVRKGFFEREQFEALLAHLPEPVQGYPIWEQNPSSTTLFAIAEQPV